MISIVENIDCMEGMAKFPDKFFDLAVVTVKYVSLQYEKIKRIANRKSRGVYGLFGFNYKRIYSIPKRTGIAIRCAFRYWVKNIKSASKNYIRSESSTATSNGIKSVLLQYRKAWERREGGIPKRGGGFICACLFRHQKSWIYNPGQNAKYYFFQSGSPERNALRREGHIRLSKGFGIERNYVSNKNCQNIEYSRSTSKQNAEGGLLAL